VKNMLLTFEANIQIPLLNYQAAVIRANILQLLELERQKGPNWGGYCNYDDN
jgi:hypothetical protein